MKMHGGLFVSSLRGEKDGIIQERKKKKERVCAFRSGPAALSKFILTRGIVKRSFYETDNRRAPTIPREAEAASLFGAYPTKTREKKRSPRVDSFRPP